MSHVPLQTDFPRSHHIRNLARETDRRKINNTHSLFPSTGRWFSPPMNSLQPLSLHLVRTRGFPHYYMYKNRQKISLIYHPTLANAAVAEVGVTPMYQNQSYIAYSSPKL